MYIVDSFLELGLESAGLTEWTSQYHKKVARAICICNPRVFTMEDLSKNIKLINDIPQDYIEIVSIQQLEIMGCVV